MADRVTLLICGLCLGTVSVADEAPDADAMSDMDFIEYLGLWEESDEEWLMLDDEQDDEAAPEKEPETDDES